MALENVFKATYKLIFQPSYCFSRDNKGNISCSNLPAIRYWFYITLITYIIILFSSSDPNHYGFFFFLTSFLYSFVKIALTGVAYYVVALYFQRNEAENLAKILIFMAGLSSLALYTFTLEPTQ